MLASLLLATALPHPAAAAAAPGVLPPLGMDTAAIAELKAAGAAPRYASFWVGPWMAQHGWGGLDNALKTAKDSGTTPVVYWYYWGDSISNTCVEHGCDGRSRAQWTSMTATLAERVRTIMAGQETLIVLENEFNKQGITGAYAPTFDGHLEGVAKTLKGVAGVKLVLGFGAWGESQWTQFPRSAAQSDYIGFQMMRGQTRHTEAEYRGAAGQVAYFTGYIAQKFNKPSFLYDLALSSYPDASWERIQAETLKGVFDNLVTAGQTGLQGVIYRSLKDHWMDPINYFGPAESHWGLKYGNGGAKPAWAVWHAEATQPPVANVPGAFEAEQLPATTGGRAPESSASGGAAWNLWANGNVRADLVADEAFDARITVVARGETALGVAPRMEVRLDGVLLGTFDPAPGAMRPYAVDARVPAGASALAVVFTNDARTTTEDRNLIIDVVRVAHAPVDAAPTASFTATGAGLSWSFDGRASSDPEGAPLSYAWSFGDGSSATCDQAGCRITNASGAGTTATGPTAQHAYAAPGSYVVKLTVSDGARTGEASRTVAAQRPNAAPSAAFSVAGASLSWSFDARASSDPDGDALAYAWDFGDGATGAGATASHAYAAPGSYTVMLTVSDGTLRSDASAAVSATRPNAPPVARIAASGSQLSWAFDAAGSSDPDGDALTYAWDLGDGAKATGARVAHEYATAGDRVVTLTVTDARGLASTATTTVRATSAPLQATFSDVKGNAWWVEVAVAANKPLSGVCASVDGGACRPLAKQWWGSWAASFQVPSGADVVFRATAATGESVSSIAYDMPSGKPALVAAFKPYDGNAWWVQARVDANLPLSGVCASVNGGACRALTLQSWGAWAETMKATKGSKVVFQATSTDGQVVKSAAYTWPMP